MKDVNYLMKLIILAYNELKLLIMKIRNGIGRLACDSTAREYYQRAISLGYSEARLKLNTLKQYLQTDEARRRARAVSDRNNAAAE